MIAANDGHKCECGGIIINYLKDTLGNGIEKAELQWGAAILNFCSEIFYQFN